MEGVENLITAIFSGYYSKKYSRLGQLFSDCEELLNKWAQPTLCVIFCASGTSETLHLSSMIVRITNSWAPNRETTQSPCEKHSKNVESYTETTRKLRKISGHEMCEQFGN